MQFSICGSIITIYDPFRKSNHFWGNSMGRKRQSSIWILGFLGFFCLFSRNPVNWYSLILLIMILFLYYQVPLTGLFNLEIFHHLWPKKSSQFTALTLALCVQLLVYCTLPNKRSLKNVNPAFFWFFTCSVLLCSVLILAWGCWTARKHQFDVFNGQNAPVTN